MSPSVLLAGLLVAQAPAPFERSPIDPILPEALRATVERADAAERDPKRGPSNALAVYEEAKRAHAGDDRLLLALRLREAGVVLRRHFLESKQFPLVLRYEQAVSTFARLDLAEPGLKAWLDTALDNHPEGKARLEATGRKIPMALLVRGSQLDKEAIAKRLVDVFAGVGLKVVIVPPKEARFVLKLGAENPRRPIPGKRAVRVLLGIEGILDGETTWTHTMYRTEAATETEAAMSAALDWLLRIGGRDLFFRWLGETAFPSVIATQGKGGHDGHGH